MADSYAPVRDWNSAVPEVASIWAGSVDNDAPSFVNLFKTPSETVCDFGDVILNVDDGFHPAVKIQVSSCIMATASKVFKALFSNRFAEGQVMRAEHQTPTEILIKDTPKDLLLLCKLLHWQEDSRPSSHRQLRGFALVVDKYDCVEAMRHASLSLFNPISLDGLSEHELFDLVTAAYFLDQPETFQKVTRQIVFAYGKTLFDPYERYTDLLPSNLVCKFCPSFAPRSSTNHQCAASLQALQVSASQELAYGLTSFVGSFTSSTFVRQMPNYACQFLQQLRTRDLWPLDLNSSSLKKIVDALSTVHVPILECDTYPHSPFAGHIAHSEDRDAGDERLAWVFDTWGVPIADRNHETPRRQVQKASKQSLQSLIERVSELCAGLCLDCFKENEHCRVPHKVLRRAQTFIFSRPAPPQSGGSTTSSYAGWAARWD